MEIPETYDRLEEFVYNPRRKNFRNSNHTWYLKECIECGSEYFGYKESEYCSKSCIKPFRGKSHTKVTKKKISSHWKNPNSVYNRRDYRVKIGNKGDKNGNWKGGIDENLPLYDTYAPQLSWCEEVRRSPSDGNVLEVRCYKCGKWFIPKRYSISNRVQHLKGNEDYSGECNFYCSEQCKNKCSVYRMNVKHLIYRDAVRSGSINIDEFTSYKREVYKLSNKVLNTFGKLIKDSKKERGRNKYHLDHEYSVRDGYFNKVPIEIISSPINLRMIKEKDNISKGSRSIMSKIKLYREYNKFIATESGASFNGLMET